MSIKDIASLGKLLGQFLALFSTCFTRSAGRRLLRIYVQGLLSDVQRKNVEAMAVEQNVAPRVVKKLSRALDAANSGLSSVFQACISAGSACRRRQCFRDRSHRNDDKPRSLTGLATQLYISLHTNDRLGFASPPRR